MSDKIWGIPKSVVVILVVVSLAWSYSTNFMGFQTFVQNAQNQNQPVLDTSTNTATTPNINLIIPSGALLAQFSAFDAINGTTLSTGISVDMIPTSDLNSRTGGENLAIAAAATSSVQFYSPGSSWYAHLYSASTSQIHVDNWYQITFPDANGNGGGVTHAVVTLPTACGALPTISWAPYGAAISKTGSGGATQLWKLPPLGIEYQEAAASVTFAVTNPSHTSLQSQTGSGSLTNGLSSGTPFSGSGASNFTTSSKQETTHLQISLAHTSRVWGEPMIIVSTITPRALIPTVAAVWFSVNSSSLSQSTTLQLGWCLSPRTTPGYTTFYRFIPPVESTTTNTGYVSVDLPIDTSSFSTVVLGVGIHAAQYQNPSDVAQGSATAIATAQGGASYVGPTAVIYRAYAVTANVPAQFVVMYRYTSA